MHYTPLSHPLPLQLGALGLALRLFLIFQHAAQNLATRALGHRIDELDAALQPLVLCLVLLHVLFDGAADLGVGFARGYGRGALDDKRLGDFAGAVVGDGDDGAVVDEVVREEMRLEFRGCDLEALFSPLANLSIACACVDVDNVPLL